MSDSHPTSSPAGSTSGSSDLTSLLARYQQAWTDGDIEGILSMTPPDGEYEASFGPNPWGQRFVGHDEIRSALLGMGLGRPGRSRHEYGETHVVGDCAFALWTNVRDGSSGPETTMHGADFYRFSDGMVAAKIAYRKNVQS
jgi:ketosteroid isomerase-like protein